MPCMHPIAALAPIQHWYTNGTVIGVTGVAVGVVAIVIAIVLWRFGAPHGLLEYSMPISKALVSRSPRLGADDLQVTMRGKVVRNPYLGTLCIINRGRRDIRSSDFDQDTPLILNLNVPVLDVLSSPNSDDQPIGFEGGEEIHLLPMLIRRGRQISVNVLTEGKPTLSCRESLADVRVRSQRGVSDDPRWVHLGIIISLAFVMLACFLLLLHLDTNNIIRHFLVPILLFIGMAIYIGVTIIRVRYRLARPRTQQDD